MDFFWVFYFSLDYLSNKISSVLIRMESLLFISLSRKKEDVRLVELPNEGGDTDTTCQWDSATH